jgi:two-component system phosphate regulon sensor histidine kinase PhoR
VNMRKNIRIASGIIFLLALYTGCVSVVFFLSSQVLIHTALALSLLFIQIMNSLLGLFLAVGLFCLLRFNHMGRTKQFFTKTRNTIEKIGAGDFNVRLQLGFNVHKDFEELVESVNNMALELSQLEKMRQEFISNVSHEIQSPLTSIRGFAHALRNDQLGTKDRLRYVEIIEAESSRLSKLSDSMLKLAYLEADNRKFELTYFRLDQQIKDIILACEPQWETKNIDMEVDMEEMSINANENLLSQVWTNIIHNSIKFTPEGGKMRVELSRQGNSAICKISDTGIGMSAEDKLHVFERFYKADKSRERSHGGNGLGLSIAKKIIDIHEGTIGVQSVLGTGTTFTVILSTGK